MFIAGVGLWPMSASAAGSWIAQAPLPELTQRGRIYRSPILAPSAGMVTTGNGIRRVSWRYGYGRAGVVRPDVRLCAASRCVEVNMARGYSDAFAGLPVVTPFRLVLEVPGSGKILQHVGPGDVQLVVDFD